MSEPRLIPNEPSGPEDQIPLSLEEILYEIDSAEEITYDPGWD